MSQPLVYLAGPITGLSYDDCTDWRESAVRALAERGIKGISPMRAKDYLARLKKISGHGRDYQHLGVFATPRGVISRDRYDTTRSAVVLVNLKGAKSISIGTVMEIAWAHLARIPLVVVMEEKGNVHDHMMLTQSIDFRVDTLEEAIDVVTAILK